MVKSILLSLHILISSFGSPHEGMGDESINDNSSINMAANKLNEEDLATMMQRYTEYNYWANQQFAEWLRTATEEELDIEIESSFSSLEKTIIHIWNAEYLWLQTVKEEASDDSPSSMFAGTKDDLLDGWVEASKNFSDYVKSMSIEDLQSKRPRSRGDGFTKIVDMIHHCMNHSTYHRGQLITMGRQVGLDKPPRTDFIYYVSLPKE